MPKAKRAARPVYYPDYLGLKTLLSSQKPESVKAGRPAHDEMLFIVVHQTYELWFKLILHELDSVHRLFAADSIDEKSMGTAVARLVRVTEVQKLLIDQLRILETMTPLDFLEFRDLLSPSSGFQSVQFRLIENRLGLKADRRLTYNQCPYTAHNKPKDQRTIKNSETEPSLFTLVEKWLERTPFLDLKNYNFWLGYRQAVDKMLTRDRGIIENNPLFSAEESKRQLAKWEETSAHFASILDERRYADLQRQRLRRLSYKAIRAALFINLYRDQPILQQPFRLLTVLADMDELLTSWRTRHALMVRRMIGMKIGTGGSSGYQYLASTVEAHKIFTDLFDLSTFLIPRSELPKLPPDMERRLAFHHTCEL